MRSIVVWLIGILLLPGWMGHLYAQMPEPTPTVTLDMRQVPLLDILMELEKQTGLFFSYESSLLKELPEVSLSVRDESLSYCLKRLFSPLPIIYRVTGQYIILKRKPRQYTISGFVRDSASYESLLGASVLVKSSRGGTMSNNYGFYSLILPPGKVRLRASYVGFKAMEIEIDLQRDTMIDFPLRSLASLGEVVIRGSRPRYEILSSRTGVIDVPAERVKSMPALLGEADLVKTLQQLPGVAVGTEGMTGLYVRGGGADENLYLLDGNPVYHVNHLLGFFSAFNPDAIKNTRFYKGSFPAEYGGRLSSVVDVRMNDGNRQEYHGNISVGLLSARANLEGPIVKDRSSFNISVRRTWLDLITGTALAIVNKNSDTKESFGYHFFDINAKVNHSFSERSRAYLSFYMGQDAFRQGSKEKHEDSDDMFLWRWGNLIGSAGWNYVFGQKLFGNLMVGYSRFRSHIRQEAKGYEIEGNRAERQSIKRDSRYKSEMEDLSVRLSVDYSPSMNHRIRMGTDYLYHNFRPENSQQRSWVNDSLVNPVYELLYDYSLIKGHEFSLFAEDEMRVTDRLRVNAGLRYTLFHVENEIYHSFQPRLSARYLLRPDLSAKISYSKMNQYVHLLSNTYVNQPTDIWVPVTEQVPPMSSHQITAGLYYNLKRMYEIYHSFQPRLSARYLLRPDLSAKISYSKMNQYVHLLSNTYVNQPTDIWVPVTEQVPPMSSHQITAGLYYNLKRMYDFSIEGYYKRLNNLIDYKDHWPVETHFSGWEDRVGLGKGKTYGVEFMAQKTNGKTTGWIGYTLSWSDRWFPDGSVNKGRHFPFRFDNRHKVNVVVSRKLSRKVELTGAWVFASGNHISLPEYKYLSPIYQKENGYAGVEYRPMNSGLSARNNYQLSPYHRLDLGVNFYRYKKKGRMGIWNISIYNTYLKPNPFMTEVMVNQDINQRYHVVLQETILFYCMPSVSYTYKF